MPLSTALLYLDTDSGRAPVSELKEQFPDDKDDNGPKCNARARVEQERIAERPFLGFRQIEDEIAF